MRALCSDSMSRLCHLSSFCDVRAQYRMRLDKKNLMEFHFEDPSEGEESSSEAVTDDLGDTDHSSSEEDSSL